MEKIKITFLGTSNAIPTEKRNHTAILLNYKDENILVDCGEGTQRQFRFAKLSPAKLTKILVTHWHGDHVFGLPGLFQTLAMSDYKRTLELYGPKNTNYFIDVLRKFANIRIGLKANELAGGRFFENKEFYMECAGMVHDAPTLAYSFIIKDKIRLDKKKLKKLKLPNSPLLGELQKGKDINFEGRKIRAKDAAYLEKGRKVTFILDTAYNENAVKIAKDADVLVCEASFSKEEEALAKEYKHLTSEQAATIAKKAKAGKLVLTHISQRYEHNPGVILKEAKKIFKNTHLVKDFDVMEI